MKDDVIQFKSRSVSDPTLSDIDIKNKVTWVCTTLKFLRLKMNFIDVPLIIIINYKTVKGYDLSSYPDVIGKWNQANTLMWEQCKSLGPSYCLPVHYEHLVLEKEKVLRQIGMNLKIFHPSYGPYHNIWPMLYGIYHRTY